MTPLRVAVVGSGAVGGYFGARMAASGMHVTFVARGEHLKAMREHGLQIKSIHGDLEIHSEFISSSDQTDPVDLVVLAVKSQDTDIAAKSLGPLIGADTAILSLQNGIDNADKIARLWGADRTLAGVAFVAARISAPGIIEHHGGGRITLGSLLAAGDEHARHVHSALAGAQLSCHLSADIQEVLWQKLAWNAPFCALSCLLHMTVGEILDSPSLEVVVRGCIEEVRDAARCRGVDLHPSTAQDTLGFSAALRHVKPSMLHDLEGGRPLEHEALNGLVVKVLQQSGKRAPINEILYSALRHIDRDLHAKHCTFAATLRSASEDPK